MLGTLFLWNPWEHFAARERERERQHFDDVSELLGLALPEARPLLGIRSNMSHQMPSGEKKKK